MNAFKVRIETRDERTILLSGINYRKFVTLLRWCDSVELQFHFLPGGFMQFTAAGGLDRFFYFWKDAIECGTVEDAFRLPGCPYYPDTGYNPTPRLPRPALDAPSAS